MSNLSHYLNSIRQGESYFSIERKFDIIAYMLAAIHIIVGIIFAFIPILPLALINGFIALFYILIVRNFIKQQKITLSFMICIIEVLVMSFFESFCVGFSAGFSLYNISMISAAFYFAYVIKIVKRHDVLALAISSLAAINYLSNYLLMQVMEPVYEIESPLWIHLFYVVNVLISLFVLIVFCLLFTWEIQASHGKLEFQNEQLHEMATKDPLTHLINRRSMNQHLQQSMETLKKTGQRFSLILGDIDDFKKVNDTYGHDAGDYVLVSVADIITQSVRDKDAVCRWGGEEILILVHDPLSMAVNVAERIRKNIEEADLKHEGQPIKVTMTFGISESIPGYRMEQLVQQADEHLYQGKKSGKNVVIYKQ